jgi:hypothetical protein
MLRNATALLVRRQTRLWALILISLPCLTASAAFVAVEFQGRVTGADRLFGYRPGALVKGYFAYDPQSPTSRQIANHAIFMFEIIESQSRFEHTSYDFVVFDNWSIGSESPRDGLMLSFSFYYPGAGYGTLSLMSSNTALFANPQLPQSVPPLNHFDGLKTLYVTLDSVQPYQTLRIEITGLSNLPVLSPSVFDLRRVGRAVSFRFLTQPSTRHAVQITDNLQTPNWTTLTNLAATTEPIAIITDLEPGPDKRFYRIQKQTN